MNPLHWAELPDWLKGTGESPIPGCVTRLVKGDLGNHLHRAELLDWLKGTWGITYTGLSY